MKLDASRVLIFTATILVVITSCVPEAKMKSSYAGNKKNPAAVANDKRADKNISGDQIDSKNADTENSATIFLTGTTLSTLKPCGCAGGQLGGFDRRAAIFEKVPAENRLIIDTGKLLADDTEQDQLKMIMAIQAMSQLQYDAVNISGTDLEVAKNLGLLEGTDLNIISSEKPDKTGGATAKIAPIFTKKIKVGKSELKVRIGVINAKNGDFDKVIEKMATETDEVKFNILIAENFNYETDTDILDYIKSAETVDVIICPSEADEPETLSKKGQMPMLITVGKLGKYIGKLSVSALDDKGLEAGIRTVYQTVPVDENLKPDEDIAELYKDYQGMVRDYGLLEKVSKAQLPQGLSYSGSDTCGYCHDYEFEKWADLKHANAYQTLVEVGSEYDPECVECHVVGLKYESGFVNADSSMGLRDVGCENCHGPGSSHIAHYSSGSDIVDRSSFEFGCDHCHTPEHSPLYQPNQAEYLKKIIHWREPNETKDVKK